MSREALIKNILAKIGNDRAMITTVQQGSNLIQQIHLKHPLIMATQSALHEPYEVTKNKLDSLAEWAVKSASNPAPTMSISVRSCRNSTKICIFDYLLNLLQIVKAMLRCSSFENRTRQMAHRAAGVSWSIYDAGMPRYAISLTRCQKLACYLIIWETQKWSAFST